MNKYTEILGYTPSVYQENFFNWVQHGVGNAVICAVAGAGKTTTCVASMKLIPKNLSCLFVAFNKSIAEELNTKLKGQRNCTAKTTHSLGFSIIRQNLGRGVEVDEFKYRKYVKEHISELTTETEVINGKQFFDYIENICSLVDFSRFNLCQSEREINKIAKKYDIPINFDECVVVKKILEWGKKNTETVDYTDMLWLPVELSLLPKGNLYDWVYVDEFQDSSLCAIQLFLKCIKRGGRFVVIGDKNQSINLFCGACEDSFSIISSHPNTSVFDLPITYRCSKEVVMLSNTIFSGMIPCDNAKKGKVKDNCHIRDIKDGDMVLCRSKAPLMNLYIKLLRRKQKCYIKGKEIGENLITILNPIRQENIDLTLQTDSVFVRLYYDLFKERNILIKKRGLDFDDATLSDYILSKYDDLNTLQILAEKCKTKTELIEKIKKIFDEDNEGICLSTIHKAKGLEADNIYILCHSCMPPKTVKKDWQKLQEKNLIYVAYTRAKDILGFVSEKEIKPFGTMSNPQTILEDLTTKEELVCKVLNKKPMKHVEYKESLNIKLNTKTNVDEIKKKKENIVQIGTNNKTKKNKQLFNELELLLDN